jgi:hypothetical protein
VEELRFIRVAATGITHKTVAVLALEVAAVVDPMVGMVAVTDLAAHTLVEMELLLYGIKLLINTHNYYKGAEFSWNGLLF